MTASKKKGERIGIDSGTIWGCITLLQAQNHHDTEQAWNAVRESLNDGDTTTEKLVQEFSSAFDLEENDASSGAVHRSNVAAELTGIDVCRYLVEQCIPDREWADFHVRLGSLETSFLCRTNVAKPRKNTSTVSQ